MSVADPAARSPYRGYRFPREIIAHAVWLYFRSHLSFRDVQDLLAEWGIIVSHETIRAWCSKFGPSYAAGLRRRRARAGDKWFDVLAGCWGNRSAVCDQVQRGAHQPAMDAEGRAESTARESTLRLM